MIVVDLGCKAHAGEESIEKLVAAYRPDILFGFDPYPELQEGVSHLGNSLIVTRRAAAWNYDGTIPFLFNGTRSQVADEGEQVPCFDFAAWLRLLPPAELVVKMDVEGAETRLINNMIDYGVDKYVTTLLVEWHCGGVERMDLLGRLSCPVAAWD